MATLGQIIFASMITLIVIFSAIIILTLALVFSGSSSDVTSTNTAPVANLGKDELLICYLQTETGRTTVSQVSVTWTKKDLEGLVYRYDDGAPDLGEQNSQFRGRTEISSDALLSGNASLLIRSVRSGDEGEYTCSISSSDGGGKVNIRLRTAAFSAPTFNFSNGVLTAEASRWYPKPNVTWLNSDGGVLQGRTNFSPDSGGIYSVVSKLQPVNISSSYTCRIENDLVLSVSKATVTGSGVSKNTYFIYSAASSLLASAYLSIITSVLCICYLT
ncbi:V-set domain-containing T-cell activation inhibitor 1 [Seriola aureovittata]|uniref:V-set domain-containing T-cell activation inhibitor 1 n=1 Tax=Seriola aureovittata TaxID=2871759 RepID=UPI0024BEA377|nr:V-set domain-containing T-cell activation inhibitor 1 [Seriola aureovittata]